MVKIYDELAKPVIATEYLQNKNNVECYEIFDDLSKNVNLIKILEER